MRGGGDERGRGERGGSDAYLVAVREMRSDGSGGDGARRSAIPSDERMLAFRMAGWQEMQHSAEELHGR